ncbi:UNKNOWN [Stylonychia lemnae]|uniref:Uncharacterized protein n=1 Tax=Stylonychia lemnae TaxID=5949 RepID=A0A078B1I5_STYLE|nr:UNKNOWN [Stylonychia lemnae]|eukprot:CDW88171.1 UNKNOWN [Stylonychia lemnae]
MKQYYLNFELTLKNFERKSQPENFGYDYKPDHFTDILKSNPIQFMVRNCEHGSIEYLLGALDNICEIYEQSLHSDLFAKKIEESFFFVLSEQYSDIMIFRKRQDY